jgi:glycosyltransferase involved in cell wall biosynthesis
MTSNLLWHSNAPHSPTGYGTQTALFCARLKDHYDNLGISAFYGLEGAPIKWNGVPVYPGIGSTYGNETIREHAGVHFDGDLRNGLVVTLMDVWVLDPGIWRRMNTCCWVPVDHEPCPPPIAAFFHESGAVPIAMSRFGQTQLRNAGLDPLYMPHGVDCDVYKPQNKAKSRKATGMPADAFIVGMVAANKGNPSRKCFAEAFEAFKLLHDRQPEARLYLHTELSGKFDGVNLPQLIDAVGLPREAVMFADQYRVVHYPFPPEKMAQIYSTFDVLLMPSAGEGFGIPAIEAQACGVPLIVSDFSAQPELVGAGWLVKGQRTYTPLKAFQFRPDIPDIYDALRRAYAVPRNSLRDKARKFAERYHVDRVMDEHMLPALKAVEARFSAQEPVTIQPRMKAAA